MAGVVNGTLPADTEIFLCESTGENPIVLTENLFLNGSNLNVAIGCCGLRSFTVADDDDDGPNNPLLVRAVSRQRGLVRRIKRRKRGVRCEITRDSPEASIVVESPGAWSLAVSNIDFREGDLQNLMAAADRDATPYITVDGDFSEPFLIALDGALETGSDVVFSGCEFTGFVGGAIGFWSVGNSNTGARSRILLEDVSFEDNMVAGAVRIAVADNSTDIVINECSFINNSGIVIGGAVGITPVGSSAASANVIVDRSVFTGNEALANPSLEPTQTGGFGGGIYDTATGNVTIRDSTFDSNAAKFQGAAVFVSGKSELEQSTLGVYDTDFRNGILTNLVSRTYGAAIQVRDGGISVDIARSTFRGGFFFQTTLKTRGNIALIHQSRHDGLSSQSNVC